MQNDKPTRDFEPINSTQGSDGNTKPFDAIDNGGKKNKNEEEPKNKNEKTARAAKATASGVLFSVRKILTYLLNIFLTILIVGIITGAVVGVAFIM